MLKPILFNTEMIRATLNGRKTVTRRVVKPQPKLYGLLEPHWSWDGIKAPYRPGDILYVRETWKQAVCDPAGGGYALTDLYLYKADEPIDITGMLVEDKWCPSIHMPREAARIFLRVKNVRVERLRDIRRDEAVREGASPACAVLNFKAIWNSTVKKQDRDRYGWDANPWVWVIEFDRISKEEAVK